MVFIYSEMVSFCTNSYLSHDNMAKNGRQHTLITVTLQFSSLLIIVIANNVPCFFALSLIRD